MDKFHSEDEDMDSGGDDALLSYCHLSKMAWFSDQNSDSGGEEEEEEVVDMEQGVDTIGEFIKEAVEDVEDEIQSVDDLLDGDVYKKICKAVENKVYQFTSFQ